MRDSLVAAAAARRDDEAPPPPPPPPAGVRAFPTAEGFGAEAFGGRGSGLNDASRMTVYKVTNLTDPATRTGSFDGSFRWAVEATGPRIIVFGVAGYIVLQKQMKIDNPYLTIAGQLAPGDGVCLRSAQRTGMGIPFIVDTSHVIIRHLRSRLYIDPALGVPSNSHASIAIGQTDGKVMSDIIIDHCSATWAYDVNLQILAGRWSNITVQWCIAAEGYQTGHQRNLSTYAGNKPDQNFMGPVTFAHNLASHSDFRNPQIAVKWGRAETYNSVVYNATTRGFNINVLAHDILATPGKCRFVGNYLKRCGNANSTDENTGTSGPRACINGFERVGHDENYLVYAKGNIGPNRANDTLPEVNAVAVGEQQHYTSDPLCTTAPLADIETNYVGFPDGKFHLPNIPVVEKSPYQSWRDVTGDTGSGTVPAGAVTAGTVGVGVTRPSRDAADQRIVNDAINNTGNLLSGLPASGFPALSSTPALPADSGPEAWAPDGDGIPTAWKAANIPGGSFPWSKHSSGYTYMERYLNQLAGDTNP